MGVVEGRRVVVLGGAGAVGEGICRILLQQGARVGVPARGDDKCGMLRESLGDPAELVTMTGEAAHPGHATAVRDALVERLGGLDDVIVSLGGWVQNGNLVDDDLDVWIERVSRNNLLGHLVAAQTWLPPLLERDAGSFLLINGGAGLDPIPGAGFVSIASAAQFMLKDVLVKEHEGSGVRINTLALMTPIYSRKLKEGEAAWLTNDEVGTMCAHMLSDAGADLHGETIQFARHDQVPEL